MNLNQEINSFFRSWQTFELGQPTDRAVVFDFDFSHDRESELAKPFSSRLHVLETLQELISSVSAAPVTEFSNKEFLKQKLRGAEAYVRQLLGEKIPFASYLKATLGITPELVRAEELAELQNSIEEKLAAFDIRWRPDDTTKLDSLLHFEDVQEFERSLVDHAGFWVARLQSLLGLSFEPDYRVSAESVDEYWANWITGTYGSPIELRINTHPRVQLKKGSDQILAAHEIAGHAMHIRTLSAASRAGKMDSCCLNTSLHGCEMFQMEGVAQSVLFLLAKPGEIEPLADLTHYLWAYHHAICNNAQIEVESGRPVAEALRSTRKQAPFLPELTLTSNVRDRSRNPIFRSLIFVYYPSWKLFSQALDFSPERKREFLELMYQGLWTPEQIEMKLRDQKG